MATSEYSVKDFQNNEALNFVLQNSLSHPVTRYQGKLYYNAAKNVPFYGSSTEWVPLTRPVPKSYTLLADLYLDQGNQFLNYVYYVEETEVYYRYLGTTLGTMADYNPIGGAGTSNNIVKTIHIEETFLSGTGSLQSQVAAYVNANIAIDYNVQLSKINIIISKSSEGFPYAFPLTLS